MIRNKVFATDVFDESDLGIIREKGIKTVVCNENRVKRLPEDIQLFNAEIYRIEGTWKAYEFNNSVIDKLWKSYRNKFIIKSIDIRPLASKWIYWTNFRIGALYACISKHFPEADITWKQSFEAKSKLKEVVKYIKIFIDNTFQALRSKKNEISLDVIGNPGIGILVNNEFEIIQYKYILDYLKDETIIIFHYGNIDLQQECLNQTNIQLIDLSKVSYHAPQSFLWPFSLNKTALWMSNILYQNWHSISSEIARYEIIKTTGIKKILINVGENIPLRNLMKPVFGDGVQVINTMNGLKSGEAHDADINFDKWLVWDNEMKELLVRDCHIHPNSLIVTGHLSEDHIRHHQFENIMGLDLSLLKDKKIISVFSVRGNRKEKVDAFHLLYDMLKEHDDWYIIVKPHPLEKKSDYILPELKHSNVIFVDEKWKNSKTALYDLLHISDLSLVFGSTVALECSWIKTPCVTFEYKSVSFIHIVNNEYIKHLNSIELLKRQLSDLKKCEKSLDLFNSTSVSNTIATILKN
ncbi:MAG: hypothetical protein ACKOXF_08980 [Chitinophagaceae bacterium]